MSRVRTAIALLAFVLTALGLPTLASAQVQYARSDGYRIAYEIIGEGEPLAVIPGFSQSADAWKQTGHVDAFVASGRKVILIDPRGHGSSDKPHDPEAYRFDVVADDVVAVLDSIGIGRADLIGYSRGGWIAMATAILHPQRVRAVIAGGAHPYAEDMSLFRQAIAGGLRDWIGLIETNAGPLPAEARSMIMANDVDALRAAVSGDRRDRSRALAESGVQVLLYAGSEDRRAGPTRKFAREAPNARFTELPGLNHFQAFFAVAPVVALVERVGTLGSVDEPSRALARQNGK